METRHEKIIKREDGSKVLIRAEIFARYGFQFIHTITVLYKTKHQRSWRGTYDEFNYKDRGITLKERRIKEEKAYLEYVTKEEVYAVKLELWEKMKPEKE